MLNGQELEDVEHWDLLQVVGRTVRGCYAATAEADQTADPDWAERSSNKPYLSLFFVHGFISNCLPGLQKQYANLGEINGQNTGRCTHNLGCWLTSIWPG